MFAVLLTPPGRGAIAVVHVCGAGAAARVADRTGKAPGDRPRLSTLCRDGVTADQVMVRIAAGFTGEETVEITCHGGTAVVEAVFAALGVVRKSTAELLERGVETGHLDRIRAEAWTLLPLAATERAARMLHDQAEGALSRAVSELRTPSQVESLLSTAPLGLALAHSPRIVLTGRPNAGKSTLFNALVEADRAMVSPIPGTTRDPVKERVAIEGVPFELADTAGLEEPRDEVERMAMDRARKAVDGADLVVHLVAPDDPGPVLGLADPRRLTVASKIELWPAAPPCELLPVSAKTGRGLDLLRLAVLRAFKIREPLPEGAPVVFTPRQERLLGEAAAGRLPVEEARGLLLRGPAGS